MNKAASETYQLQQIMAASPARRVAMLFDKAISCLNDAIRAIEADDIETRWRANKRAMEIVEYLWTTLDMEKGGEIAANLDKLYRFLLARMPDIDLHNNAQTARDAIGILDPLRRSWHTVADRANPAQPEAGKPADPSKSEDGNDKPNTVALSA